ncbi:DNA-binding protein [Corynebacterium sp.]|uniref:DNA-binding protein n=1 Tax=Corynebacterium sp. TaxID=1720 RepID=UPI0025BAC9D3|nr:DNA-binding protein [Corynebacterium sp.]
MSPTQDAPTTALTPQQRVWRAADALAANGQRVTARAVRVQARIDATAVQTHLPAWRAEQEAAAADAAAAPPVPEQVIAACGRIWTAAWAEAESHHRRPLDEAGARIEELERQLAQLDTDAAAAEAELAEAQQLRAEAEATANAAVAAQAAAEAQALTEEKARRRAEARAEQAEAALREALQAASDARARSAGLAA